MWGGIWATIETQITKSVKEKKYNKDSAGGSRRSRK
jgi:hypothetical protein